jgi:tripartite-type tricarboxylate transporter receptor subunit TctC
MNRILLALALAALLATAQAAAQTYPSRPITVIMPVGAGGTADVMARLVAAKLQDRLGQPVVVENKPGAGTAIGSEALTKAAADGYTIGYASVTPATHHLLYKEPRFNWVRDTTPVVLLAESGYGLAFNPQKLHVKDVAEFVALLKANPGKMNYSSSGVATSPHIVAELFKSITGTDMIHIAYKESPRAVLAVVTGEVDVSFMSTNAAKPHVDAKQLQLLAVTSRERDPLFPQVPTMRESGVDLVNTLWFGLSAPARTPSPIVMKLNQETDMVLKTPEIREKFRVMGLIPLGGTPADLARQIDEDVKGFSLVMEKAGIPKQ